MMQPRRLLVGTAALATLAALSATQLVPATAAQGRQRGDPVARHLLQAAAGLRSSTADPGASKSAGLHTRQIGRLLIPGGLHGDVWAHGNFAYVGTWSGPCPGTGVKIIDVSNVASPRLVATAAGYPNTSAEDMSVRSVRTSSFTGDLLAVGLQDCGLEGLAPGLTGVDLWNVTNPNAPAHFGFFDTGAGGTHEISLTSQASGGGERVFALAAVPFSEIFSGGAVGDFQLVEVTDPRHPFRTDDWGAGKDGGLPFGIADPSLPAPFNCTLPAGQAPACRGHFPAVFGHSTSPSADGLTAYVAYWDIGAVIIDISNPSAIRMVGRTIYPAGSEGDTHSAMPNGAGTVLVTTDEDFSPGELVAAGEPKERGDTWGFARIWGITSPANPVHLSDFATPHSLTNSTSGFYSVHNPQIRGTTLYLSWYSDGLRIVDIANPSTPKEIGFYRPKPTLDPTGVFAAFGPAGAHPIPFVWGVYPLGDRIFLSGINFGLYIVTRTK
jgi:hypothetical protein